MKKHLGPVVQRKPRPSNLHHHLSCGGHFKINTLRVLWQAAPFKITFGTITGVMPIW